MRHWRTVLTALVMLAAACGGDAATTETTAPEVVIERPAVNTEAPPPTTASQEETETVPPEPESAATQPETTTTQAVECPEGTVPEDGGCLHVPDETTNGDTTTTEATETPDETTTTEATETPDETTTTEATETPDETTTTEATETPDETTDGDTTGEEENIMTEPVEDDAGDAAPEPQPEDIQLERVIVWEGVDSEDKCLVAGGIWSDTHCEYWVFADPTDALVDTYWHPKLMDDAFNAVDPETVDADHWETFQIGGLWGFYNYVAFFHFDAVSDEGREAQLKVLRQVSGYAVRWAFMYSTDWLYFPIATTCHGTTSPTLLPWSARIRWERNAL